MPLYWREGLFKEIDDDTQLYYIYRHRITPLLALKGLLLLATLLIDQSYLSTKDLYLRAASIAILLAVNYLIPVFKEESVSVIKGIGLQLAQRNGFTHSSNHKFIPSNKIVDVIINEGFKGLEVVFYLAALVKNGKKLELILPNSNLKLHDLLKIRKDLRKKLDI